MVRPAGDMRTNAPEASQLFFSAGFRPVDELSCELHEAAEGLIPNNQILRRGVPTYKMNHVTSLGATVPRLQKFVPLYSENPSFGVSSPQP